MSYPIVFNQVIRPGQQIPKHMSVTIELVGERSRRISGAVTADHTVVEGAFRPDIDENFIYKFPCVPNDLITDPVGTVWKETKTVDGETTVKLFRLVVADGVGETEIPGTDPTEFGHWLPDLYTDEPGELPSGPLAAETARAIAREDEIEADAAAGLSQETDRATAREDEIAADLLQEVADRESADDEMLPMAIHDPVMPSALPLLFNAMANYRDDTASTLRIIGLGSSVGVGATLPSPSTNAPVGYFASRFEALFNPLGNLELATTNGSVNGHAMADILTDYTAAKTAAGGTPTIVVIAMGMNDGGTALYHAGQTLTGVGSFLARAIDAIRADGGEPVVCTSPHPNTDTYDFTYYPFVDSQYPGTSFIPALNATEGAPTIEAIGDGGAPVRVSYRHLRVNALMRQVCIDRGVAVIDAEAYWLRALRTHAVATLFGAAETVHPNLLGHQVSYHAAIDDFLRSLHAGYAQAAKAPYFRGNMGVNNNTPTAGLHVKPKVSGDAPFKATSFAGVDNFVVNDDGTAAFVGQTTFGGPVRAKGASPVITDPSTYASLGFVPFNNVAAAPQVVATLADNQAGTITIEGFHNSVGRQVSTWGYVASAAGVYLTQHGVTTGSSTAVFTVSTSGLTIVVTPNNANTNLKVIRVDG